MKATTKLAAVGAAAALLAVPAVSQGDHRDRGWDRGGRDLDVVGLTADGRLISFESDSPDRAKTEGKIRGLVTDTKIVGLDYRPASGNDGDNGDLYGLGDRGGVYTVDDDSGQATLRSRMNVALAGTSFGVDFNPTVDRLRVISDTGQNLRVNVDDGTTMTDGPLTYPATPTAPAATATGVTGAAYTNNDADANTATTLYDIDSTLDQTVIQSPANSGMLAATGKLTVDTNPTVGFDIYSAIRDGSTVRVQGFASLTVGGQSGFYKIKLFSGRATSQGSFSSRNQVTAIAIPLNQR